MGQRLLARARALEPELISLRRQIHRRPELGFQEVETRTRVRATIAHRAPSVRFDDSDATGLVARLGGRPEVVLRACLDALPVPDRTGADYTSEVDGTSHACGHDAQAAVLTGATILLAEAAPEAPVLSLFQPAEEIDTGARSVLSSGVIDDADLTTIVGFHGHPALPAGEVGVSAGPVMACITTLRCRVEGRGSHGAEPHLGSDAIASLATLINDWQVVLGRRTDGRRRSCCPSGASPAAPPPTSCPRKPSSRARCGTCGRSSAQLWPTSCRPLPAASRPASARPSGSRSTKWCRHS